jgi:hypothetical protein
LCFKGCSYAGHGLGDASFKLTKISWELVSIKDKIIANKPAAKCTDQIK